MRRYLVVLGVVLLAVGQARGDAFRKEAVAATAKWVVHADIEKFNQSQMGMLVAQEATNGPAMDRLNFLRGKLGIDPLKDLTSLTVSGQAYGDQAAVAVVRGNLHVETIEVFLGALDTHETIPYGNRMLHKWLDKGRNKPGVVCFVEKGVAVLGGDVEKVKEALDVLDGKKDSLKAGSSLKGLDTEAIFLLVSAEKGSDGMGEHVKASVLQNTDWLTLAVGEAAGKVNFTLKLAANTPENAVQMEQVIRGMLAYATLSQDQNPALADAVKTISVTSENGVISIKGSGDAQEIFKFLKAQKRPHGPQDPAVPGKGVDVPPVGL